MFTWLMLGGFILLVAPQSITGKIQLGFVRVFRWPLSIGGGIALTANTQQTLEDAVPRREYDKLQNHCDNLQATLTRERERSKIYDLYNANVWDGAGYALAKVITADRNGMTIKYDRGARLVEGQFVLRDNSIVGRISEASAGTAHVRLFTDPKSAIQVKIGELDVLMLMKGNGDNSAMIPLVDTKHEIKVGDKVFASDARTRLQDAQMIMGRFLDAQVIVGKVARCVQSRKNPLVWDITVEPACDIASLEDVAVIIMEPQK